MDGKARQCSGCGHIETANLDGGFYCASCGSESYTLYVPLEEIALPSFSAGYHGQVQYKRGGNECARCGALLLNPEESAYCAKCEKYLGLD